MAYFNQPTMFSPITNSQVDFDKETVEGRIGNILKTDSRGNYTNNVVRQSQDRQSQAFNARGLLNSSMAMQAGQEAAISKAIDIATPDAKTYYDNRRSNVDANNSFAMKEIEQGFTSRQDYQKAAQNVSSNFQRQMDTINASNMTPEDKNVAIAQAQAMRDGELAYVNNLYSRMPAWSNDWLSAATPMAGMDLNTVTNQDTLSTIANDPGQSQATRDQALQRLQALRGGAAAGGGGGTIGGGGMIGNTGVPSAGTAANGQQLPQFDSQGRYINWTGTMVHSTVTGQQVPLKTAYEQYVQMAQGYGWNVVSPAQFYEDKLNSGHIAGGSGGGNGTDGEGAGSGTGVGAGGDNY